MLVKEFLQMRRDRVTLGMIVGVPLMQLFLFGFAINFNPKALPTAIAIDEETREIQRRRAARFKPSRSDIEHFIEILSWLSWLKRQDHEGADGVRIIRLRAFQVAAWSIGQRMGVSDDTVRRRHLAAVTRIASRYWQRIEAFG
ncbi:MAG: hypothetical protein J0H63_09970 [Rhizobiales bacterium]|nr:hypothetical protein [Hyphomicrobiales bacterium]